VRVDFCYCVELEKADTENSDQTSSKLRPDFERTPVGVWKTSGGSFSAIQE